MTETFAESHFAFEDVGGETATALLDGLFDDELLDGADGGGDPPEPKLPPPKQPDRPAPYDKDELEKRERQTREYVERMTKRPAQPPPDPFAPYAPQAKPVEAPKQPAPKAPLPKQAAPAPPPQQQWPEFPPIVPLNPGPERVAPLPQRPAEPNATAGADSPFLKPKAEPDDKFWKDFKKFTEDDNVRTIAAIVAGLGLLAGIRFYRNLSSDAVRKHLNNSTLNPTKIAAAEMGVKAYDRTTGAQLTRSADGRSFELTRPDGTNELIPRDNVDRVRYEFVGADARQVSQLKAMTELQLKGLDQRAAWVAQTDVVRDATMKEPQRFVLIEGDKEVGTIAGINADHTVQVKQPDGTTVNKAVGADSKFVLKVKDDVVAARKAASQDVSFLLKLASPKVDEKEWKRTRAGTNPIGADPNVRARLDDVQKQSEAAQKQTQEMQRQLDEVMTELRELKADKARAALPGTVTDAANAKPANSEPTRVGETKPGGAAERTDFTEEEREKLAKDYEARAKTAQDEGSFEKANLYKELAAGLRSVDVAKRSGTERFIAEMCGGKGKALALGGGALVLVSLGIGGLAALREHQKSKSFAEAKFSGGR